MIIDRRPWGDFRRFTADEKCTVKIVRIKPGRRNSLQYHRYRKEFWYVIDGRAKLRIGNRNVVAERGDSFVIPIGALHRWGALKKPVTILEIAYGKFDENDIVRVEDDYGRKGGHCAAT